MNNNIQPYNIKEIFPGHFHMILDFLEIKDVLEIISPDYKYICKQILFYHFEKLKTTNVGLFP